MKGSLGKVLVYSWTRDTGRTTFEGFVNSNYVGCLGTGKSLTGYGIAISWKAGL